MLDALIYENANQGEPRPNTVTEAVANVMMREAYHSCIDVLPVRQNITPGDEIALGVFLSSGVIIAAVVEALDKKISNHQVREAIITIKSSDTQLKKMRRVEQRLCEEGYEEDSVPVQRIRKLIANIEGKAPTVDVGIVQHFEKTSHVEQFRRSHYGMLWPA